MSDSDPLLTDRRAFLGAMGAGAAALGLGATPASLAAALVPGTVPGDLEAWFDRIQGDHKAVFDAPDVNNGLPAIWPRVYRLTMQQTYGGGDASYAAVLILRHQAIALAMEDAMWSKYGFGDTYDVKDAGQPATRNVYARMGGSIPGTGVANLLDAGVLVGVCNMALTAASGRAARKMDMEAEAVKQDWLEHLLPGVQVVPSGVMAVVRAQEKGCAYVYAG